MKKLADLIDLKQNENYNQSDNKGIFHNNVEIASAYWKKRKELKILTPFILYRFNDETDAVRALTSIDCIKIAQDTEELICTKALIYGYYPNESLEYEAVICGDALGSELFITTKKTFEINNGIKINERAPEPITKTVKPAARPTEKMSMGKKQGKFLHELLDYWTGSELIDYQTKEKLQASIIVRNFDWKKLAKYSFWISIICMIISGASSLEPLANLIKIIFTAIPDIVFCILLAFVSVGFFRFAHKRRIKYPDKILSNEFFVVAGVYSLAGSIAILGKVMDSGSGHFSLLFLLATVIYGLIGILFPSKLVWIFSILCLGAWFGTESGYVSGWGAYYLGMNYPLRFVVFGSILTVLSFAFGKSQKLSDFQKPTYILGLLYLFIALWILSIFGNYGDMDQWEEVHQIVLIGWGLLFGLAALAAIVYGLMKDDYTSRSFGITFLFINLYTKFFEYFWDNTHKGIFFLILSISFWQIGKRAETIWSKKTVGTKEYNE